jgi:hypothetical protein
MNLGPSKLRSFGLLGVEASLFCFSVFSLVRSLGAWAFIDSINISYLRFVNLFPAPSSPNVATAWIISAVVSAAIAAACGYYSRRNIVEQLMAFIAVFAVIVMTPFMLLALLRAIENALPNVRFA